MTQLVRVSDYTTLGRVPNDMAPVSTEAQPMTPIVLKFEPPAPPSTDYARISLGCPVRHIRRLWMKGYYIDNPSSIKPIRISFEGDGLTSGMKVATNITGGEGSIIVPNFAITSPLQIATWKMSDGVVADLGVKLYDTESGAQITYDYLYLWLEAETLIWQ